MASFNQIIVIGNMGSDPEMRYTATGRAVTTASLATSKRWTGADGAQKEETTWHRIEFWGQQAEFVNQYGKKGRLMLVIGEQKHEQYEKDGQKKYASKISAKQVQFLDKRSDGDTVATTEAPEDEEFNFNV